MTEFGVLKKLDPRQAWPHEAADFSPWLAEHLAELGGALGMEIELQSREAPVGSFSLDLLARDVGRDRLVIIENQLEATDHDHLGKLLTYAAGFDAGVVIWIATEIREEHRQALDWLNQRTESGVEFFAVVLEMLQIDDSRLAYNFRPVAFPNSWRKTNVPAGSASERGEGYRRFFQSLIDELREHHRFTGARAAQPTNWYSFASGIQGVTYGANFALGGRFRAEVYIDRGEAETNKALFAQLEKERNRIESEFGEKLEWEKLENRRACRIAVYRRGEIEDSADVLESIRQWAVERLLKLKTLFGPKIEHLVSQDGVR